MGRVQARVDCWLVLVSSESIERGKRRRRPRRPSPPMFDPTGEISLSLFVPLCEPADVACSHSAIVTLSLLSQNGKLEGKEGEERLVELLHRATRQKRRREWEGK